MGAMVRGHDKSHAKFLGLQGDLPPWVLLPAAGSCLQPLPGRRLLEGQKVLGGIGEDTERSYGAPG